MVLLGVKAYWRILQMLLFCTAQLMVSLANLEGEETFEAAMLGQAEEVCVERVCDDELILIKGYVQVGWFFSFKHFIFHTRLGLLSEYLLVLFLVAINPPMVWPFKTFQNLLTGKMAINMSEPFKTLHNFLLLHYHTFQYPLKGFER